MGGRLARRAIEPSDCLIRSSAFSSVYVVSQYISYIFCDYVGYTNTLPLPITPRHPDDTPKNKQITDKTDHEA
jgi:hypothetical protein